jgi:hypothetical protein
VSFRTDDRAVSQVIGAVLLFGILIILFATYQASIIPGQNTEIEAQHYQDIQGDLGELQGTLVTAAETGEARSTAVTLGPRYPSRALGVNAGPPSGQLRAESVGGGEITSGAVPLDETCRLPTASQDTVPTHALVYTPGYNYYQGGDVPHRLEETLLYQPASSSGGELARTDQSMVDPATRSVTLYPLQSDLQSGGTGTETYRFVGGYGQSRVVTDPTITIPTRASEALWRDQVAAGNPDVSVTSVGSESMELSFSGTWEVRCRPVAQDGAPAQLPTADAGRDTSVPEGSTVELDGTGSASGSAITDYAWTLPGSPPDGVSLSDASSSTPIFDASDADVSADTAVTTELTVTDATGTTDTDTATVTVTNTASGGGNGDNGGGGTTCTVGSNTNPSTIQWDNLDGFSANQGSDTWEIAQINVQTQAGNDLSQLKLEITDSGGTVRATRTTQLSSTQYQEQDIEIVPDDPNYDIPQGNQVESYTLTATVCDVNGNSNTETRQTTS